MSIVLGCIADDYTGAADLANTLTREGLHTLQVQGVVTDFALPDADAIVVALKSRSIAPARARALSLEAHAWLASLGAAHIMFKICSTFDSTDRGNIGPVIEALREIHGGALMPVTPAFPATGRTVYKGHLFVGDVLLSQSPLKDHPLNPMRDSNLVTVLRRQSTSDVGLAQVGDVEAGAAALRAKLNSLAARGCGSVIVDALNEAHLETIGSAVLHGPVSTGASGLGLALARGLVASGRVRASGEPTAALAAPGPAAMIAGSCSRATLDQIAEAEKAFPVLRLDSGAIVTDPKAALTGALAWSRPHLEQQRPFLLATSAERDAVERVQATYGLEKTAHAIETVLASLAARLAERGVRRLVVAGGETSGAIVEKLGIRAFRIGAEVAPGVPIVHALGRDPTMTLALKSGNFGAPTFFADALEAMEAIVK